MKKWLTLLLTVVLMLSLAAPAFAGVTGEWTDKTLEIAGLPADKAAEQTKMEKDKNNVADFSEFGTTDPGTKGHRMTYEYNQDLLDTVLLKQDNDRNPNLTEYITYKMDKNIAGVELDVLCCAGLGDPRTDLTIFISKTGAANSWIQLKTQATYYEFDPNYYIVWDKAYWFHSTLTNAQKIPTGYKYLKIQFNACNEQGDVPWNVAVDDVKVIFGTNVDPVTIPEDKKLTQTWEEINAEREATKTTNGTTTTAGQPVNGTTTAKPVDDTTVAGTTTATNEQGEIVTDPSTAPTNEQGGNTPDNNDGNNDAGNTVGGTPTQNTGNDAQHDGNNNALIWIILAVVVVLAGAGATIFFIMKKKN